MNLDEQFLEMTDKIRLIELVNENVRLISNQNIILKRPKLNTSGVFFCSHFLDEL